MAGRARGGKSSGQAAATRGGRGGRGGQGRGAGPGAGRGRSRSVGANVKKASDPVIPGPHQRIEWEKMGKIRRIMKVQTRRDRMRDVPGTLALLDWSPTWFELENVGAYDLAFSQLKDVVCLGPIDNKDAVRGLTVSHSEVEWVLQDGTGQKHVMMYSEARHRFPKPMMAFYQKHCFDKENMKNVRFVKNEVGVEKEEREKKEKQKRVSNVAKKTKASLPQVKQEEKVHTHTQSGRRSVAPPLYAAPVHVPIPKKKTGGAKKETGGAEKKTGGAVDKTGGAKEKTDKGTNKLGDLVPKEENESEQ